MSVTCEGYCRPIWWFGFPALYNDRAHFLFGFACLHTHIRAQTCHPVAGWGNVRQGLGHRLEHQAGAGTASQRNAKCGRVHGRGKETQKSKPSVLEIFLHHNQCTACGRSRDCEWQALSRGDTNSIGNCMLLLY